MPEPRAGEGGQVCACKHRRDSHIEERLCIALLADDTVCTCIEFAATGRTTTRHEEVW